MVEFFKQNWELLSAPITGILTWFFITKPYQIKDLQTKDMGNGSAYLSNVDVGLNIYKRMFEDFEEKIKVKDLQIEKLELEIKELRMRILKLEING